MATEIPETRPAGPLQASTYAFSLLQQKWSKLVVWSEHLNCFFRELVGFSGKQNKEMIKKSHQNSKLISKKIYFINYKAHSVLIKLCLGHILSDCRVGCSKALECAYFTQSRAFMLEAVVEYLYRSQIYRQPFHFFHNSSDSKILLFIIGFNYTLVTN